MWFMTLLYQKDTEFPLIEEPMFLWTKSRSVNSTMIFGDAIDAEYLKILIGEALPMGYPNGLSKNGGRFLPNLDAWTSYGYVWKWGIFPMK